MAKRSTERYVTEAVFVEETKAVRGEIAASARRLDAKIDSSVDRLDQNIVSSVKQLNQAIGHVTLSLLKTQHDVAEMKQTMATREDINRVVEHVDAFARKVEVFERKVIVHDYRLNEVEPKLEHHEKRIGALETGA